MKKKRIKIIIISLLIVAIIGGTTTGIIMFSKNSKTVDVYSVSMMSTGDMGYQMTSEGMVCDDAEQSVYVSEEMKIKDVFVTEGQEVKAGDALMSFDVSSISFSVEMKQLEIQSYQSQLESQNKKLKQLKATKPVQKQADTKPDNVVEQPVDTGDSSIPEGPVISDYSEADEGEGTAEAPYIFSCSRNTMVSGELLNKIKADGKVCIFQITDGEAAAAVSISVYGDKLSGQYSSSDKITLFGTVNSGEPIIEPAPEEIIREEEYEQGYTAEELKKAVDDLEKEIAQTDLSLRMAQVELSDLQKQEGDGTVYAKADGVVTKVGDKDNPTTDGEAFLQVSGTEGYYITGLISELDLDTVEVGQPIMATNYETGETYDATISKIDTVPSSSLNYYGECNPNSSFYGYVAYIDDAKGLKKGDYLELAIDTSSTGSGSGLYIEEMMIKEEKGKSFVYKEENGKLKKQQVVTGKSLWGSYLEIKSGVTEEDYLAFPYGVKEGQKANKTDEISYY